MPQRIVGIDIGSYSIKVAEIERSYRDFALVGFFEQPIAHQESLGREISTGQALVKLLEEYNLPSDQIYAALPGQATAIRLIDLPFGDFKKVDATIEFEMENYLPLPLEEMIIDYQILNSTKTSSSVLVSYGKKSEFVKILNMMNSAEADPRFVGSEPIEMANLMKLGVFQPEGAYAIVDLGHEKTNVTIFVGSSLQYARTILVGGKDLTQSIADQLKIPVAEAEQMKIEMGQLGPEIEGADETTRSVHDAMQTPLEDLCLQIKQTFMAFQEAKSEVVQALVLCGGTSRLAGIDHYLSTKLKMNVSFLDPLDIPANRLADTSWCRPVAATAVSLAYRGVMGSSMKDIQFRRGEFAYQGEVRDVSGWVKQVGIMLGIILIFATGSFIINYASLKGRSKSQTGRLSTLTSQVLPDVPKKAIASSTAALSTLTGKVQEAQEKKKKVEDETKVSILSILKEFSAVLPAKEAVALDVDNLTIISKRLRIQGRTNSFEAVDQIKTALGKSRIFKNVATENVKKGTKGEIRFNLSLEVVDEAEGKEGA